VRVHLAVWLVAVDGQEGPTSTHNTKQQKQSVVNEILMDSQPVHSVAGMFQTGTRGNDV